MPNQKFLSHALKSQLMEILKFQYSNVLVHQSQQPASHAQQHHALIVEHAQLLAAQNAIHLNAHRLIVHVLNALRQIVHEMIVRVLMHHVVKSPHLKRLLLTSAKSQRLVQPSL
jgi:hypothetical protein